FPHQLFLTESNVNFTQILLESKRCEFCCSTRKRKAPRNEPGRHAALGGEREDKAAITGRQATCFAQSMEAFPAGVAMRGMLLAELMAGCARLPATCTSASYWYRGDA